MVLGSAQTFSMGHRIRVGVFAGVLVAGLLAGAGAGAAQAQSPAKKVTKCELGGKCKVGDRGPGGGVVFLLPSSKGNPTGKYFEAAPAGWSAGDNPEEVWCNDSELFVAGTKTPIGAGAANTALMIASCSSGAGNAAHAYAGGGKTDWFLPSKDELNALYKRRAKVGGFGDLYWSSSQYHASSARDQHFTNGYQHHHPKLNAVGVRPVRAF
ncbi:MAG: DUF1566 domain-containing protein [Actinomycetota bacterium]|nr:DUF1566 domain-containing protein [Actinomycetota bacterium]